MPAYRAEWDAFVEAVKADNSHACNAGRWGAGAGNGRSCQTIFGYRQACSAGRCLKPLDLITIGRSSVDLYGAQIGGPLEDMRSFDKYIGGSPTNIACGTARLGLKSAVITAVGDEHMGRFIREELVREGVDVRG